MAAAKKPKQYTVVVNTWLNIREKPSKYSAVVGRLEDGDKVTLKDEVTPDGWKAVDGGYVMAPYLR